MSPRIHRSHRPNRISTSSAHSSGRSNREVRTRVRPRRRSSSSSDEDIGHESRYRRYIRARESRQQGYTDEPQSLFSEIDIQNNVADVSLFKTQYICCVFRIT